MRNGLSGLEWAVSIPGTAGGAVIGNAGAHGGDIAGLVDWVQVAYPGAGRHRFSASELRYAYRTSLLKQQLAADREGNPAGPGAQTRPVVLSAGFRLTGGDPAEIRARAETYLARRRASQPVEPSAGSIFRNPPGDHAGRLVEAAGLKGHRIGGAQISPRHANFIVNIGGAKAADVLDLIDLARSRVRGQFGVELAPEILFLGQHEHHGPI
jgi:UDP-N-acetylmuramate dehydrogenase